MRISRIKPVLALMSGLVVVAACGCSTGFIESVPTNVTPSGATLNGKVASDRSEAGVWWFDYGTTAAYGKSTPQRAITFTKNVKLPVSEPVSGLTGATQYHYRLCAKDQDPSTGAHCSGDAKFTTAGTDRPRYQLHIDAADGSSSNPQSGVAEVAVSVDGEQTDGAKPGCATQNCTLSRDWTLNTSNYAPGPHTVTVTAADAVGRTTSRKLNIEIQRDTTDPDLTVSGPLKTAPEGWVDQHDYTVTGRATDSGYGATSLKLLVDDNQVGQAATQPCPDGGCSLDHTFTVNTANYSGGAHDVKLVAIDGAGNDTTTTWTVNVNPDGHIPTSEASSTLQAADATSGDTTLAPTDEAIDPAEIADGNNPGLEQSGGILRSTGTPAPSTMTTNPRDGFTIEAPDGAIHVVPTQVAGDATAADVANHVAGVSANTSSQVDTVVRPIFNGVMTFENIRDATAPEEYSWQIKLDPGQTLESSDSQTAEMYYDDGTPAMMIQAEPAHDATGATVPTSLSVTGSDVITLTVHHRAGSFVFPVTAGHGWHAPYVSPVLPPNAGRVFGDNRDFMVVSGADETSVGAPVLDRATGRTRYRAYGSRCAPKILGIGGCSYWHVWESGTWFGNARRHVVGGYAWRGNGPDCSGNSHIMFGVFPGGGHWSGPNPAPYGHGQHLTMSCEFTITSIGPPCYLHFGLEEHLYGDGYQRSHVIPGEGDCWLGV